MQTLGVLLLLVPYSFSATLGKKINVPNNDPTLQDLIYKSAVPSSNNQIHDNVWWIPANQNFQATKISVPMNGKPYSTYSFVLTLQKSTCDYNRTPASAVKKCKLDPSSTEKKTCQVTLAWTDKDYSSIEEENYCSR